MSVMKVISRGSLYDVISEDETNVVKIMIPDFKLHEFLDLISSKLCKPTWFDAYENPSGQIYFNVIWTKNDDPYSRSALRTFDEYSYLVL